MTDQEIADVYYTLVPQIIFKDLSNYTEHLEKKVSTLL